jgi:putative transposase
MLINVMVTPGDVQDRDAIAPLLEIARNRFPTLKKAIADGGYQGQRTVDAVQQQASIPIEIVKRSNIARGFYILPTFRSLTAHHLRFRHRVAAGS